MTQTSTLRKLVDQELEVRNTTLDEFLTASLEKGLSLNRAAAELARLTGIPVSQRTVYRWADDLKVSA